MDTIFFYFISINCKLLNFAMQYTPEALWSGCRHWTADSWRRQINAPHSRHYARQRHSERSTQIPRKLPLWPEPPPALFPSVHLGRSGCTYASQFDQNQNRLLSHLGTVDAEEHRFHGPPSGSTYLYIDADTSATIFSRFGLACGWPGSGSWSPRFR